MLYIHDTYKLVIPEQRIIFLHSWNYETLNSEDNEDLKLTLRSLQEYLWRNVFSPGVYKDIFEKMSFSPGVYKNLIGTTDVPGVVSPGFSAMLWPWIGVSVHKCWCKQEVQVFWEVWTHLTLPCLSTLGGTLRLIWNPRINCRHHILYFSVWHH